MDAEIRNRDHNRGSISRRSCSFRKWVRSESAPGACALALFSVLWAIYSFVAVKEHILLFADGALHAFVTTTPAPWDLYFANWPTKYTPTLLTILPVNWLYKLGILSDRGAWLAYQIIWYALPALFVLASWTFLPKNRKNSVLFPCIFVAGLVSLANGFPTEAVLAGALCWLAVFSILYGPEGVAGDIVIAVLLLLLLFTHPSIAFVFPILGVLLLTSSHHKKVFSQLPISLRKDRIIAATLLIIATLLFLYLQLFPPVTDNVLVRPIVLRGVDAFKAGFPIFRSFLMVPAALFCLSVMILSAWIVKRWVRIVLIAVAGAILLIAAAVSGADDNVRAYHHYFVRTFIGVAIPPTVIGYLLLRSRLTRSWGWAACLLLCAVGISQFIYQSRFLENWKHFREALLSITAGSSGEELLRVNSEMIAARTSRSAPQSFFWPWSLPYTIMLLQAGAHTHGQPRTAVGEMAEVFVPFTCAGANSIFQNRPTSIPPQSLALLTRYNCDVNPNPK